MWDFDLWGWTFLIGGRITLLQGVDRVIFDCTVEE